MSLAVSHEKRMQRGNLIEFFFDSVVPLLFIYKLLMIFFASGRALHSSHKHSNKKSIYVTAKRSSSLYDCGFGNMCFDRNLLVLVDHSDAIGLGSFHETREYYLYCCWNIHNKVVCWTQYSKVYLKTSWYINI